MSPTPWRQPALSTLSALLAVLSVLLVAVDNPASANAADGSSRQRDPGQSAKIQVLPPIHQTGPVAAPSTDATTVVTATVRPAQNGRPIVLKRRTDWGWRSMATIRSDADGIAVFAVPTRTGSTYRAVARPYRGLPVKRTAAALDTWGDADFVDEFSGTGLGADWENRIQFYNPWGGRACSKGSPDAVDVADGALQLRSMPDPAVSELCTATDVDGNALGQYPYRLNGHISTQNSADFLYGVAAARMKFQRDPGAHAAFWLQPRGLLDTGPTPWGAEIDVVEWYGMSDGRDRMASAVHAPTPSGEKIQYGGAVPRPDQYLESRSDAWWRNYHVFSVEWTPTAYTFRIGGHEVWRTGEGVSHDPEFLILSMLSSDFELPQLGVREGLEQTASVDWVEFWQAA
jgi:hypothetical protein